MIRALLLAAAVWPLTLASQLARLGLKPDDIRYVGLSHAPACGPQRQYAPVPACHVHRVAA